MRRSGNLLGRFEIRPTNGRDYIVFKGNKNLRKTIRGNRYGMLNPTIIKMGIGTDGLKASAKGGALVTVVVSVSVNSYGWIFDESIGWKDFLLNVSTDLVKAAIAVVAGYFAAKTIASFSGMIALANAAGFVIGLYVGWKITPITYTDISTLAQKTSYFYSNSVSALSSPITFLSEQKIKINDFVNCTAEAAGSVILGNLQRKINDSASGLLHQSSPFNVR